MTFCPECGKPVAPKAKFCRNCGASQLEDVPSLVVPEPVAAPVAVAVPPPAPAIPVPPAPVIPVQPPTPPAPHPACSPAGSGSACCAIPLQFVRKRPLPFREVLRGLRGTCRTGGPGNTGTISCSPGIYSSRCCCPGSPGCNAILNRPDLHCLWQCDPTR
jgi:hypothetical protein